MRIAPEGRPFIAGAAIFTAFCWLFAPHWIALLFSILTLWVLAFFRDPERQGPRGDNVVIAPADGRVVSVVNVDEPEYMKERTTRVSIFMNVFNVHVNRYPSSGRVEYRHYMPGRFAHAADEKASKENEQSTIGLLTARGRILVRQIAGLVARRIVTDHDAGTAVRQGDRMGLIRFGSRVDVFVPATAKVMVHTGEKTVAGVTVVAQWD
jgi:phosphatidylserine decarboxylase